MQSIFRSVSFVLVAASMLLSVGVGQAFAGDDEGEVCIELKAALCEVCGAEACEAIIATSDTEEECAEVTLALAEGAEEAEALGEEAAVAFWTELCSALAEPEE